MIKIGLLICLLSTLTAIADGPTPFANNNILPNGSFENKGRIKNIKRYIQNKVDIEEDNWAADWTLNTGVMSPGKYRIIKEERAPDGKAYLQVETTGGSHIYTSGGHAGIKYHWSIWAKANSSVNGNNIKPKLILSYYKYGQKSEIDKQLRYRGAGKIKAIPLKTDGKWREYKGTFVLSPKGSIKKFSVLLDLKGNVSVDGIKFENSDAKESLPKTLLYVPFDKNAKAMSTYGDDEAKIHGQIKYVKGIKGEGVLFDDGSYMEYEALKNFDQEEGAVAFWFKPLSTWNDDQSHCLFEVPLPPYNFIDSGFCISKGFSNKISPDLFYFINCPPWKALDVAPEKIWHQNEWTHLLVCWSKSKSNMSVYVNGVAIVNKTVKLGKRPDSKGRKIIIGARQPGSTPAVPENWDHNMGNRIRSLIKGSNFPANAVIDELYIFDKPVNSKEAWKLYGGSGEPPENKIEKLNPKDFINLTDELKTSCIPFAKPLGGKKLKVLFIIPISLARDVVELKQRMDIECDTYLLSSFYREPYYATKHAKRFFYGVTDKDMLNLLEGKLAKKLDIVAVVDADWRFMPAKIKSRINSMVKNGQLNLLMTSRGINNSMLSHRDKESATAIIRDIPWKGLPEMFAHSNVKPQEIPEKSLTTAYYGKGRVAAIKFDSEPIKREAYLRPDAGLTPCLYKIGYSPAWRYRYGRYLNLVAKTILWLGNKKMPWQIKLTEDGKTIPADSLSQFFFHCDVNGIGDAVLDLKVRNEMNEIGFSKEIKLNGNSIEKFTISELKTGLYYIDAIVRSDNKVVGWSSSSFKITSHEEIENIILNSDHCSIGDAISGKINFKNPMRQSGELYVKLKDSNNRIYQQNFIKVPAGQKSADFSLKIDDPLTTANFVEAELKTNDKIRSDFRIPFFVDRKDYNVGRNPDIFPSIIWGNNYLLTGSGMFYVEQLKKAGFNSILDWPKDKKSYNMSMWGFTPVAYMTSLRMKASTDGGTVGGCWALPSVKKAQWAKIEEHLADTKKYSPLIYSLGDENIYRGEFGYSKEGIEFYHKFLRNKYGTIEKLNDIWQSNYKNFSSVPRLKLPEIKKRGNYPALVDHREAQEAVWREMFIYLRQKIKSYDERAVVGAEGSETHDLEKMLESMDFWAPYGQIRNDVFMRKSSKLKGHWYGSYCEFDIIPKMGMSRMWEQLFKGFSNASFYFAAGPSSSGEGILKPDGSYTAFFKETQLRDLKLITNGIGQLLRENASTLRPEIIMHWSRRSRIIGEIDQKHGTSGECDGRLILLLDKLNVVDWEYMTGQELMSKEIPSHVKVFILPLTLCLDEKEIQTIERFVKRGGTLICIGPAGIRNVYGKLLSDSQLKKILGIKLSAPYDVRTIDDFSCNALINKERIKITGSYNTIISRLGLSSAKVLAETDNIPLITKNVLGNGTAYFINCNISRTSMTDSAKLLDALLSASNISKNIEFSPKPGPGRYWGLLGSNNMKLLGVILDPAGWNKGTITLPEKSHIYDVMQGKYLGYMNHIKVNGEAKHKSAHLYSIQPTLLQNVSITMPQMVKQNRKVKINCSLKFSAKTSGKGRVIRIQFKSPDNKIVTHYQKMIYTDCDGNGSRDIEFAINDQLGTWTVVATDIASGIEKFTKFKLTNDNNEGK
jgi:hypothetical protein